MARLWPSSRSPEAHRKQGTSANISSRTTVGTGGTIPKVRLGLCHLGPSHMPVGPEGRYEQC